MDMLKHPGMADMPELLEKLDALRKEGKKIVFTNGCYDILHPGHVDLLERCKAQGDVLVLGLNSDESVKRQGKGDDRPVNPYPVRAFVLAHLESVDFVVRFDEDTPAKLIEAVRNAVERQQGMDHLKPERIPEILDGELPQQAIAAAFRKYKK